MFSLEILERIVGEGWLVLLLTPLISLAIFLTIVGVGVLQRGRDALEWTPGLKKSALTNWTFMVFNRICAPIIAIVVPYALFFHVSLGLPRLDPSFWDAKPILLQALIGLLASEFVIYWVHRLMHTRLLWPIHAVHHSDRDMNYMTGDRAHILERMLTRFVSVFCLFSLGARIEIVIAIVIFAELHDFYVHAKLDIDHGPFNWLIASPQMHQWHHADHPDAYGKNLAIILPIWDKLFGTYYNPGKVDVPLGFADAPGHNFFALMAHPFVAWWRMAQRRRDDLAPAE
ncbi:MAG: sterol desaturase family protein [Pseudomonadota bacterium]